MDEALLTIRKVSSEDARAWFVLVNKVWRDAYRHIFPEEVFAEKDEQIEEKVGAFADRIQNSDKSIAYCAEYKGELIGVMCGSISSSYEWFDSGYAELIALYIEPVFQSLGVGGSLKDAFERWAKQNGASKYVIGVLKDNAKARRVYEAWGGKLSEHEQQFVKSGVGYPVVFYTFSL